MCFNDKTAIGVMAAAAERGLRMPRDLSVTGFDDIDVAQAASPMLTTVRQPLAEMGRMAVSLLIRLIDRQPVEALHVELATELVVRGSTGPAPAGPIGSAGPAGSAGPIDSAGPPESPASRQHPVSAEVTRSACAGSPPNFPDRAG